MSVFFWIRGEWIEARNKQITPEPLRGSRDTLIPKLKILRVSNMDMRQYPPHFSFVLPAQFELHSLSGFWGYENRRLFPQKHSLPVWKK